MADKEKNLQQTAGRKGKGANEESHPPSNKFEDGQDQPEKIF